MANIDLYEVPKMTVILKETYQNCKRGRGQYGSYPMHISSTGPRNIQDTRGRATAIEFDVTEDTDAIKIDMDV